MENIPSNKTKVLTKSMNMYYIKSTVYRRFYTQIKFLKNEVFSGKNPFFVISPFCTSYSICLNIGFCQGSFARFVS